MVGLGDGALGGDAPDADALGAVVGLGGDALGVRVVGREVRPESRLNDVESPGGLTAGAVGGEELGPVGPTVDSVGAGSGNGSGS